MRFMIDTCVIPALPSKNWSVALRSLLEWRTTNRHKANAKPSRSPAFSLNHSVK